MTMVTAAPAAIERQPSGKILAPPIYFISGVAELQDGDHTHDTWHARVVHEAIAGSTLPMIVKAVRSQITVAVEVACGLAARELRLNVPLPGLVVAERDELPGLSEEHVGARLLLVGSHYQRPDALFSRAVKESAAAEEMVWQAVCASPVAKQGAAWDELIANPDRHCENVLFDGTQWWLFDHDQALPPAASYAQRQSETAARQEAIAYCAPENLLVRELLQRYGGQHQAIIEQCRRMDAGAKRLYALAQYSSQWKHPDGEIQAILELVSVVLGLIHLRLPALAEKLQQRVAPPQAGTALWT
jgi:hypothetical protein